VPLKNVGRVLGEILKDNLELTDKINRAAIESLISPPHSRFAGIRLRIRNKMILMALHFDNNCLWISLKTSESQRLEYEILINQNCIQS
jgi:hypothetical protein